MSEAEENENNPIERLARVIRDEAPILLIGAGLSQLVGYDGWWDLLEELKNRFPSPRYPKENPVPDGPADIMAQSIFDEASDVDQEKWKPVLMELFSPCYSEAQLGLHCRLLQLPFSGVITTNYDKVIEDSCKVLLSAGLHKGGPVSVTEPSIPETEVINLPNDDVGVNVRRFLMRISSPTSRLGLLNEVLHLHGFYQVPESIILRQKDYQRHYGNIMKQGGGSPESSPFYQTILSLFTSKPVVCFGFSMSDPFIKRMNGIVNDCYGGIAPESPYHWVVLNSDGDEKDEKLKREFSKTGICPVFYDVRDDYSNESFRQGLNDFLTEIESTIMPPEGSEDSTCEAEDGQGNMFTDLTKHDELGGSKTVNALTQRTMRWK